jgi:hypothetical protein
MKWSMVMNPDGYIADHIHLTNQAAKGKSGRIIALNKELKKQLIKVKEIDGIDRADSEKFVIRTRQGGTSAQVIVNIFQAWLSEARICRMFKSQRKAKLHYAGGPKSVFSGRVFT